MDTNTSPKSFRYSLFGMDRYIRHLVSWSRRNFHLPQFATHDGYTTKMDQIEPRREQWCSDSYWRKHGFYFIEMSREWDNFSLGFCPLRVTQPKGEQISTYRLQLPYKYNIPLIASSTLAHWLLSNTLFIMVSQGSYYQVDPLWFGYLNDPISLPADATVGIGTAAMPLLILAILG
ncbi:hypothetical protein CGCF415_v010562 [Colletotrichum fructicola]|uniref:Uncharacterized protein n=1 Tax=Colletotrichum fructicola (strain Nara gc5) TaxID=1213859 RepID=A0A7J6IGW3_COLFN|nr:hypothetical protein CGGC5_v016173 [Colletotrichum fructicola Nara gc5]KAF4882536.1 hypothetical protein CGCFRS4_v014476 [Colletotrichum fructicola]KAF4899223.1 hypothetical protein CGCF415_v010562 [Colletotrichum fructicola]KAF4930230.1 hypothetical protein CGCF245_v011839 [Colletotrichum fructicola]